MRPFMEKKRRETPRDAGKQSERSEIGSMPGNPDDLSVVTRVKVSAEGIPEEVECAVMDATLVNWRVGPIRLSASSLVQLIHSGRVFHCVFPTPTGFALGPRLLALRTDGGTAVVLEGGSEQGWAWRDMPRLAPSPKD